MGRDRSQTTSTLTLEYLRPLHTIYFLAMPSLETIMDSDYVWFSTRRTGGGAVTPFQPFMVDNDALSDDYDDYDDYDYGDEE